jgi:hypothetical protein
MTSTDDILALAAHAAPSAQAEADLALFAEAVTRGADTEAVRALRTLRPASGGAAALPDSAAWRAWLMAAAATAAPPETTAAPPETTARYIVCAAASALAGPGDDRLAAVAAGTRAAELVETVLVESVLAGSGHAGSDLAETGWSVTTVSAVVGAGLAAGMMLRLEPARLRHALGVCATQAAGLRSAARTQAGPLQAGKAAFNAVEAAQLAGLGFTSSREPLDGRRGLFALFRPPAEG